MQTTPNPGFDGDTDQNEKQLSTEFNAQAKYFP
jgi:hypothetical protein